MTVHNRISALIVAVALGFPAAAASAQYRHHHGPDCRGT